MVINQTRIKIDSISATTQTDRAIKVATSTLGAGAQMRRAPAVPTTLVKGEVQISTSATKTDASRQLAPKFMPEPTEKRKANNPILIAHRLRIRDDVPKTPRNTKAIKPTTLSTGSGNDVVNIEMGKDGRVHVTVNGKDTWSGSIDRFKKLTIDTGDGNDVVTNLVDGARIETGKGNDTVTNRGSNTHISTGEGNDTVFNLDSRLGGISFNFGAWFGGTATYRPPEANKNVIDTGDGNDTVINNGSGNTINTGRGDDLLRTHIGGANKLNTGEGKDIVETSQWDAAFGNFKDPDEVEFRFDPLF